MAEITQQPAVRLELLSQPKLLAGARALVAAVAQRYGFSEAECGHISLAVDEALCNVINHGYNRDPDGRIWVSIWPLEEDSGTIRIVIEDLAPQVDPEMIRPRDLDDVRPGGLGVHIIREIMDEVIYERRGDQGMRLTLVKSRPQVQTAATQRDDA